MRLSSVPTPVGPRSAYKGYRLRLSWHRSRPEASLCRGQGDAPDTTVVEREDADYRPGITVDRPMALDCLRDALVVLQDTEAPSRSLEDVEIVDLGREQGMIRLDEGEFQR